MYVCMCVCALGCACVCTYVYIYMHIHMSFGCFVLLLFLFVLICLYYKQVNRIFIHGIMYCKLRCYKKMSNSEITCSYHFGCGPYVYLCICVFVCPFVR